MNITDLKFDYADLADQKLEELDLPGRPAILYEPVKYTLSLGGKRIRFFFTVTSSGMCGASMEEAIPAALAIELLHNFTLLHDDVMDSADTRRGNPSVYRKWGTSAAILSGDILFVKAIEQLHYYGSNERFSKEQYNKLQSVFYECAERVCEGQAFDLEFEGDITVTVDDYIEMVEGKTAALISGAFRLGGTVADADQETLEELALIGNELGIAFQIQDDLLDVVGDPEKFGKQRGGDIIEGKITYLTAQTLERADASQKKMLTSIISGKEAGAAEIESVIALYKELDIIRDTRQAVESYYSDALRRLQHFPSSEYRNDIEILIEKLTNREF
ncbi:MAG: polyprenyl synthetase family protein [Balneolaceae bacterium]|nr:polyprenyl synthetase family protein [Balneolaceae bacterium]